MIGNGARICVNQKEEGYIVSRLRKRLQSLIDLARKAKACHSRRKLAASARISRSGCFLNRVFVLKSCSWLKVFSAANGLECIRGQSNPLSNFVLSAKLCPIFALSARLCCFSTAAIERECSCLSAKICRFWRPLIAVSDNYSYDGQKIKTVFGHKPVI